MSAIRSTKKKHRGALRRDSAEEYTLVDASKGKARVWITVGPFSVLLNRTYEGLIVDIWPKGAEDGESIDTVAVRDTDVTSDEEEPS